jgi:hypothetical protein
MGSRAVRRVFIGIGILLAGVAAFGAILLSPIVLREIDQFISADWSRLSEIGQTYGAASAILAMFALGGVVLSLFFQARQARAQQVQAVRHLHFELFRMTLERPDLYLPLWDNPELSPTKESSQYVFTNLIFNYWWMAYDLGVVSEQDLRRLTAGVFRGPVGRSYWKAAQESWVLAYRHSRRGRRFLQIIGEMYASAIDGNGSMIPSRRAERPIRTTSSHRQQTLTWVLATFASGVLLGAALRRRRPQ